MSEDVGHCLCRPDGTGYDQRFTACSTVHSGAVPRMPATLGRCVPQLQGLVVAQKPQEFGPFWDLDRWEVSLQDQQLVAADLVV